MISISSKNDTSKSRVEIRTFVFFDLETTGFIQGSKKPKITELSLVATSRDSLCDKRGSLPRVMHKLRIPLQPLSPIPLIVSQITGLYNDLLEYEQPFDDHVYQLLNSFISRLQPPVCFVAHNGDRFDYPILLSELSRIKKSLPEDILCIDSWTAFKTIFSRDAVSSNGEESLIPETVKENFNMFDDGCDTALAEFDFPATASSVKMEGIGVSEDKCEMDVESMQKLNETTPTHQIKSLANMNQRKVFNKVDGLAAKKRLPFTRGRPVNFKLDTVYEHLVGEAPLNSHSAEADCLSLLMCAIKIGEPFIRWADRNASPLVQCGIKKE